MRKRLIRLRLLGYLAVIVCMCVACTSSRKVLYLQDVKPMVKQQIDEAYEVKIHKDDMLAIMINSKNPELALPFNMPLVSYQVGYQSSYNQRILGYLVDSDGCIDFPIFGRLHVAGMTRKELTKYIKQRLVEEEGEEGESYVGVEDEEALNAVYELFREKHEEEFRFLDEE